MPVIDDCENAHVLNMAKGHHRSLARKQEKMEKSIAACTGFLQLLVDYLNAYYGKPCILLVDEYDSPIVKARVKAGSAKEGDEKAASLVENIEEYVDQVLAPVIKVCSSMYYILLLFIIHYIMIYTFYYVAGWEEAPAKGAVSWY